MGIIGSAVGGALGIGASIFGGISASKAMKKVKKNLEDQVRENQDWYDRKYNEDATQRTDAQRILTITNDNIRQRNKAAAATQGLGLKIMAMSGAPLRLRPQAMPAAWKPAGLVTLPFSISVQSIGDAVSIGLGVSWGLE